MAVGKYRLQMLTYEDEDRKVWGTRLIQPECDWICGARQICESLTMYEECQITRTLVPIMLFPETLERLQACVSHRQGYQDKLVLSTFLSLFVVIRRLLRIGIFGTRLIKSA